MVHRINMILNDDDNNNNNNNVNNNNNNNIDIQELKTFGKIAINNSAPSTPIAANRPRQPFLNEEDEEELEIVTDDHPTSPKKKFRASDSQVEIPKISFTTGISSEEASLQELARRLNNLNNNSPSISSSSPITTSTANTLSKSVSAMNLRSYSLNTSSSSSINNTSLANINNLTCDKKELEQQVVDSDDEYFDDDEEEDELDEEEQEYFRSKFDEMRNSAIHAANVHASNNINNNNGPVNSHVHNASGSCCNTSTKLGIFNYQQHHYGNNNNLQHVPSTTTTPLTSPKSNPGTPSRPFPTLDYKIKSESVKQNPDGTYSCPYPTCNKTIKGNKGNLSSHLRWHRRLDAEAGELRDTNPMDEGEEEFTTPLKPSQRGVQLRNQMIRYGLNLFRQDSQGKYLCFFEGCSLRMLTNFSRHIAKHERKGDRIKPDLVPLIPAYNGNNNPGSPSIKRSVSSPSSPTTTSTPFSPILSHTHHNSASTTPCQSPLTGSTLYNNSPSIDPSSPSCSSKLKRKLTVNTKIISTATSTSNSTTNTPSLYSYSEPCTPTMHRINLFPATSPRSLSSPSFTSLTPPAPTANLNETTPLIVGGGSKGKLDSIIDCVFNDSEFSAVPSSPSGSPMRNSTNKCNLPLSPLSPPTSSSQPSGKFGYPQKALFKDIQWDYSRSPTKKSTTPLLMPTSPLSQSSSSIVPFSTLYSPAPLIKQRSKEDEVVAKSLLNLSHGDSF
ncbi:hypothetical protein CYY_002647 [Polysphondylium violaceum]|uniref:Uncharacterized protein n=1 Tax=Polysphondylium violaceum TaxID=133409 RepID=A0A8J4V228_9MYCE|nr:hypothetical protein CYY_002647 [Polysphondylium violaceum]